MTNAGRYVLVAAIVAAGGLGCASGESCVSRLPPLYTEHVVVFWLKEPGNDEAIRRIVEASQEFRSIPGVIRVDAGPVLRTPRANVDRTFDVAVVMLFESDEALEAYQVHPRHKALLAEVGPLVERTVVYDFARWPPRK